jgi:hypothetical protein
MLSLPINVTTLKKSFIDGDGTFTISTDKEAWQILYDAGKPFSKDVQDLVDIKFGVGTTKNLKFGDADNLTLSVDVKTQIAGRIDLIWPSEDNELVKKYKLEPFLTPATLYMAVLFNASADAGVEGGFPVGPLSANFGVKAGGHVGYERLVPYPQSKTVKEILTDLFGGIRLPQSIDSISEIPGKGEVITTNFGGYLKLRAGLNWGYSFTGTRSFELEKLKLELDFALRIAAGLSFGYQLAGDFTIEARQGAQDQWVRFIVRKKRKSETNFAADFGIEAKLDLNGLPESADEFLEVLFGNDAKTALGYLAKAEKYSSLEELEKELGKRATEFLQELSHKLLDKPLSNETLKEFLAAVKKVTDTYHKIDQRIIDLYKDYLARIPELNSMLDTITGLSSFEGLKNITDDKTWNLIRRLWGERFYDLLLSNDEFQTFLGFVASIKKFLNDDVTAEIRKFIAQLKANPLSDLFKELEKYNTPEKLKSLSDERLKELVEKLVGKAFDQLGDFKKASQQVNAALKKITAFKDKWYEKVSQAVHQSFEFNLHYEYTRATEDDSLLDVELNLAAAGGKDLASAAAAGDFSKVLDSYDPTLVRINPGALFTHKLTKSTHLQINVLGWGYERLSEFLQNVEHAIETEQGGLLHVFTIESQIKQLTSKKDRKKLIESIQSTFLLRAVGETFQPTGTSATDPATGQYVLKTLSKMSVQYALVYRDDKTKAEELTQYLDLAATLGLIPNRELLIAELNSQFPDGLGKVTVDYIVRYDDQAVRNAFTLSGDELADWARRTARQVIGTAYTGRDEKDWLARVGFAYQSPAFYELYKKGFTAVLSDGKGVTLPGWFTGGVPLKVALNESMRHVIVTLFNVEKNYVKRLVDLDEVVDKLIKDKQPIPLKTLQRASGDFVSFADDLDGISRENSFFAIFDKLVQEGASNKGRRESAIILRIEPPVGEPVVKYLMT